MSNKIKKVVHVYSEQPFSFFQNLYQLALVIPDQPSLNGI
jgi:hypothetical protein